MTSSSDGNRPAQAAPGRPAGASGDPAISDFTPKQPVAFSGASLLESGETPAEAARRLGMIDPAFMRRAGASTVASGPDIGDALVASRAPALDAAPPVHAAPALAAGHEGSRAGSLEAIAARRTAAPQPRGAVDQAPAVHPPEFRPAADLTHPNLAVRREETFADDGLPAQAQAVDPRIRMAAAGSDHGDATGSWVAGAAAAVKAFIANWRAKRAEARAAAAEAESPARQHKLTPREKRWRRRRRRMVFEEALAWVLVPVILVGVFYALVGGLAMFGMSVDDLVEGLNVVWAQLR